MRVLIVDDDVGCRVLLKKILEKSGYETEQAQNGAEALSKLLINEFDIVLTDWMMPVMDGLQLTSEIRKKIKYYPLVVVITALSSHEAYLRSMQAGADEFIAKPISRENIVPLIEKAAIKKNAKVSLKNSIPSLNVKLPDFNAVCIAASTGGGPTLELLLKNLPEVRKFSVFIVLHCPVWLLNSLPEKLLKSTGKSIILAENDLKIEQGCIYIAPGNKHLEINSKLVLQLSDSQPENFVRPAADPLFRTAATVFQKKCTGVVLSGLGLDGTIGCGFISAAGGKVIVQDPTSAIAPGMPQSIIDFNLANVIVKPEDIAKTIVKFCN